MGVLSVEELLLVLFLLLLLPLPMGVEAFLGEDDPNPTGVLRLDARPPPDRMLEDRLTELPPLGESSELSEMLEPVLDGGREPLRLPAAPGMPEGLRENPTCSSM